MTNLIGLGIVLCLVYLIRKDKAFKSSGKVAFLFAIYLFILLQLVGFPSISEWAWLQSGKQGLFHPIIQWIPFKEGVNITDLLNICLFIPCGLLLPFFSPTYQKFMPVLRFHLSLSLIIECSQLLTLHRITDMTDLLMNVLGGLIGFGLYNQFKHLEMIQQRTIQKNYYRIPEPVSYLFIAIFASFLT